MESVLVFALIALCAALCYALYWWPRRRMWAIAGTFPGPRGYPLIGDSLLFAGTMTDTFKNILKLYDDYGSVARVWLGPKLYVFIKDPDDIQRVLGDPKIRNRDWTVSKAMEPFFGNGLLSLRGDEWKVHRRMITPTFHFKILESFVEVFGRKSLILMERLKGFEGQVVHIYEPLALCTLDAICETAIGTTVDTQATGRNTFLDNLYECVQCIQRRAVRPWLLVDAIYPWTADGRRAKPLIETAHAFSETVIAQKLDEYRRGIRSPGITTASNKRVSSFLDMLIDASETQGSILSPEEIRDEVTTMAAAGLETTASTMSFLLVLVALHPEVQAELHREMDEVFGSDSRAATCEDIHRLLFLDRCIRETLRLFPIVPLLNREINEDVQLPNGLTLPAGCSVFTVAYAVHRDPRYYPDPLKFWPDRWLPENVAQSHPFAYLPFSAGPRNCVGQKYAQLQMKSILSSVLRQYRVTTSYTMDTLTRLEVSVTLCIDQQIGYQVRLDKR